MKYKCTIPDDLRPAGELLTSATFVVDMVVITYPTPNRGGSIRVRQSAYASEVDRDSGGVQIPTRHRNIVIDGGEFNTLAGKAKSKAFNGLLRTAIQAKVGANDMEDLDTD